MFLICDLEGTVFTEKDLKSLHRRSNKTARDIIDWSGQYKSTPLYKEGRAQATIDRAERAMKELGRKKDLYYRLLRLRLCWWLAIP